MPKRTSTAFIAYGVFLALVLVSGAALAAGGYDENPFDQLAFMVTFTRNGNAFELGETQNGQFTLPNVDSSAASSAAPEGFTLPDLDSESAGSDTGAQSFTLPNLDSDTAASDSNTQSFTLPDLDSGTSTNTGSAASSNTALTPTNQRPARPDGDFGGGSQTLNWSDFGSVLYDLWFMAAVTAVVIPLQYLIRFVIRQTKRRPTAAPAH